MAERPLQPRAPADCGHSSPWSRSRSALRFRRVLPRRRSGICRRWAAPRARTLATTSRRSTTTPVARPPRPPRPSTSHRATCSAASPANSACGFLEKAGLALVVTSARTEGGSFGPVTSPTRGPWTGPSRGTTRMPSGTPNIRSQACEITLDQRPPRGRSGARGRGRPGIPTGAVACVTSTTRPVLRARRTASCGPAAGREVVDGWGGVAHQHPAGARRGAPDGEPADLRGGSGQ